MPAKIQAAVDTAKFDTKPLDIDLKALRGLTGLNQSQFWGPLGVTQSGGSRYESGRMVPAPVNALLNQAYPKVVIQRARRLLPKKH